MKKQAHYATAISGNWIGCRCGALVPSGRQDWDEHVDPPAVAGPSEAAMVALAIAFLDAAGVPAADGEREAWQRVRGLPDRPSRRLVGEAQEQRRRGA